MTDKVNKLPEDRDEHILDTGPYDDPTPFDLGMEDPLPWISLRLKLEVHKLSEIGDWKGIEDEWTYEYGPPPEFDIVASIDYARSKLHFQTGDRYGIDRKIAEDSTVTVCSARRIARWLIIYDLEPSLTIVERPPRWDEGQDGWDESLAYRLKRLGGRRISPRYEATLTLPALEIADIASEVIKGNLRSINVGGRIVPCRRDAAGETSIFPPEECWTCTALELIKIYG